MLSQSTNAIVPEQAVTYKFKVPEFAELFETMSPEQIHISLEGAMNVVFGQATGKNLLAAANDSEEELEEDQSDEEDQLDHESQIVSATTFALFAHRQGLDGEDPDLAEAASAEDSENNPEYLQLEETFRSIVEHFSQAIAADEYNQDVTTLFGEMQFYNHIELFTYNYDTKNEVLSVTLTATLVS